MNNKIIYDVLWVSVNFLYGNGRDVEHVSSLPYSLTLTAAGSQAKSVVTQKEVDFQIKFLFLHCWVL